MRHLRLAAVVVRHPHVAAGEPPLDRGDDSGIFGELQAEHFGDDLTRHVVVGRPETASQDDEVRPGERVSEQLREQLPIVADDGLGAQVDAERGEAIREEQRVRIEPRRSEQLAAHRDDLRSPKRSGIRHAIHAGNSHNSRRSERFA
jgi:hypothetical protein